MKRVMTLILTVCICFAALAACAESWDDAAAAYKSVLDQYVAGLSGDEAIREADESIQTCYMCCLNSGVDPLKGIGYIFQDLDGDGSMELMIGEAGDAALMDGCIFAILTLKDGQPVTVHRGWERYRVYPIFDRQAERFGYYAEGSSGATNSVYEYGLAGAGMAQWDEAHSLEANGDFDEDTMHWTLDGKEISEEEANALIASWQQARYGLYLIPLSEL